MSYSTADLVKNAFKGMAMGAADVVPGVSGGTIAFITGIYETLIDSIHSVNLKTFNLLRRDGIGAAWKAVNGPFLLSLLIGIGISIMSLAKMVTYLMAEHPVPLWSLFFGLIIASVFYIGAQISKWSASTVISLIVGAAIAFGITLLTPAAGEVGLPYVFLTGMIAICAMILPGISGSFIALLMGAYTTVFGAIGNLTSDPSGSLPVVGTFAAGAVIGLLAFSRLLKWLFATYHDLTMALLTGFMIGSLNKVWPWKEVLSYRTNSHGKSVPLIDRNVDPNTFVEITGQDAQLGFALLLMIAGGFAVWLLSRFDSAQDNATS